MYIAQSYILNFIVLIVFPQISAPPTEISFPRAHVNLRRTGSEWKWWWYADVRWSRGLRSSISLAAAFCSLYNGANVEPGNPASMTL